MPPISHLSRQFVESFFVIVGFVCRFSLSGRGLRVATESYQNIKPNQEARGTFFVLSEERPKKTKQASYLLPPTSHKLAMLH